MAKYLWKAQQNYGEDGIRDFGIDKDELKPSLDNVRQKITGWDQALMDHVIELAKQHGAESVTFHSARSKTDANKGTGAEVIRKFENIYDKLPEKNGFEPDVYENVESAKEDRGEYDRLKGKKIWRLRFGKKLKKAIRRTHSKLLELKTYLNSRIIKS